VQVSLVHRPVAPIFHGFWIGLDSSPEIRNHAIKVIYRLDSGWMRASEQYSA
jgi:hypothetical protein